MPASLPFIVGYSAASTAPLGRYLPPLPSGTVSTWLKEHVPRGAWVLDPFGASPGLVVEAAHSGYRVLVAANNPVVRFLLELEAAPLTENQLQAALAELATLHKGNERLEPHIQSLYQTDCARCSQPVAADAFLWERGMTGPFARVYTCPHCGDSGERPATEADQRLAAQISSGGPHRARALERVALVDDPDRPHVEEALATYPGRAVYSLFTIVNKLDTLQAANRPALLALLLAAFDQANSLWPYASSRARPRQLNTPNRFRENNVWKALEAAVLQWSNLKKPGISPVPLVPWPGKAPAEGGISVFQGRLKDLTEMLAGIEIQAAVSALPRPNQAFWALSALWAGWLWGREAAAPFKSVLRRRRYDWGWHATALQAALSSLASLLQPGFPFFGIIGEAEPGFISAALISAAMSGFECKGVALRAEENIAQVEWRRRQAQVSKQASESLTGNDSTTAQLQALAQPAGQHYLLERGEPSSYLPFHTAAMLALTQSNILSASTGLNPSDAVSLAHHTLQQTLSYRGGFVRYNGSEHSLEAGYWWLKDEKTLFEDLAAPLADRVEMALVRFLQKNPGSKLGVIDQALCQAFPGLLTPSPDLIAACLNSYGEQVPPEGGRWQLRESESPKARRTDLAAINALLSRLGRKLGYQVIAEPSPMLWQKADGEIQYVFYIIASAVIGKFLISSLYAPRRSLVVYPGGRATLIGYKLETNPRLSQAMAEGWQFLKFRHVRRLAENSTLTPENFGEQLALDPLTNTDAQIQLL